MDIVDISRLSSKIVYSTIFKLSIWYGSTNDHMKQIVLKNGALGKSIYRHENMHREILSWLTMDNLLSIWS